MAVGRNAITLCATDLAGNTSSNSYTYILDYSIATNPQIQILWPSDGATISGDQFTCRGRLDDPTAALFASVSSSDGTAGALAVVERNGAFWAEDLPLSAGNNVVTLTATNSAGLVSTSTFTIVKSDVVITMDTISDYYIWQESVGVSGWISDSSYSVWVNGRKGTVDPQGFWSVDNVPINDGGTACFDVTAYSPEEEQPEE
jgi:hypothetical protein